MSYKTPQGRFLLYPEPIRAPFVPYKNQMKKNPRLPGWMLVVAVFLIESFGFFRRHIWRNAGFESLRNIKEHLQNTEPRFDPTVIPLEDTGHKTPQNVKREGGQHFESEILTRPQSSPAPIRYSVADYRALYLSSQLTPLAVANIVLPLIRRDTSPPGVHSTAWISVRVELVIQAAEESTLRYKEKRSLGPLDGILVAIKDEYDVEGYVTTLGAANYPTSQETDSVKVDSWCVKMLKDAGAIIMGKVTMVEYGMDTSGNNPTFGTPLNPYSPQYYTGGSSSGSAYAVSTGLVPIAMGSDAGGSVRIPSSFCSVVGFKPTHGRLSFRPNPNHASTCAVKGPIAADVRSLAALYAVVSEPHPNSPFHISSIAAKTLIKDAERAKVIGIPEAWLQHAAPGVQKLFRGIIKRLAANKNYTIIPIEIPFVEEGRVAHAMTMLTDASTAMPDTYKVSLAIRIMMALGRTTPSTDYLLAQKLRHVIMQHLAWLWQKYPGMIIVTPTTGCAGWPIRSASELKYGINDGNRTQETMEYIWMANLCGVPSISIPVDFVVAEGYAGEGEAASSELEEKVPVGLMATGEWASESALLQFGLDVEEECTEAHCRPPTWVDVVNLARRHTKDNDTT